MNGSRLADIILTQVVLGGFFWLVFALELTEEMAIGWAAAEVSLAVAGVLCGGWAWLLANGGKWHEASPRLAGFLTLGLTWAVWMVPAELY